MQAANSLAAFTQVAQLQQHKSLCIGVLLALMVGSNSEEGVQRLALAEPPNTH